MMEYSKKNEKKVIIEIVISFILLLLFIGVAYSYYVFTATQNSNEIGVSAGRIAIEYKDCIEENQEDCADISASLKPGEYITKTFSIENIGTGTLEYDLNFSSILNTFLNDDLIYTLEDITDPENEEIIIEDEPVPYYATTGTDELINTFEIEESEEKTYRLTITFIDADYDQSNNINAEFDLQLGISNVKTKSQAPGPVGPDEPSGSTKICTATQAEVEEGYYEDDTYGYTYDGSGGWQVTLLDLEYDGEINAVPCTYINDKPITSMSGMFRGSAATSIDASGWDTSNVTNMNNMFANSSISELDLTDWDVMNVTNMSGMFVDSSLTSIDISGWAAVNVTNMVEMFAGSRIVELDLSQVHIANVVDMTHMFAGTNYLTMISLRNLNVESVQSFNGFFEQSNVQLIDMGGNFMPSSSSQWNIAFRGCTRLNTIYVNPELRITGSGEGMFDNCTSLVGGSGTQYDSSKIHTEYAHLDGNGGPGYFSTR